MYLLDSNAVISALLKPNRFGRKTKAILSKSTETYVSSISIFEIASKQMLGKIKLSSPIQEVVNLLNAKQLGFHLTDAVEVLSMTSLDRHDPFDRMILATARAHGAQLITSDRKMLELGFDWIRDSAK